jgi:predicted AAA+ superfamily ATPase
MLPRTTEIRILLESLSTYPAVGIIGARQVGKTTLAGMLAKQWQSPTHHFDLEDSEDLARLSDPMLALKDLEGLIILDEVQRLPEIFPTLRVLIDKKKKGRRFLILGSASPVLLQQSSESLAGRIHYHRLSGLGLDEIPPKKIEQLWVRGCFPRSFLADTDKTSLEWRKSFITTFLERDLPQLGVNVSSPRLRRFWSMLAHYHGQIWNASEFARSFGVADTTVRQYLDRLTDALVVRQIQPWHENLSKRQVKSPKVYICDSGLVHALLNLASLYDIEGHPKSGATWEGFIVEQLIRLLRADESECFHWATHAGAELDFLHVRGSTTTGFEIKKTVAPKLTKSMHTALQDLRLKHLYVIHAGNHSFSMAENITALPASGLASADFM